MYEEQLEMIIDSYGLTYILEALDLEPVYVLEHLIEQDIVDEHELYTYFFE